MGFIYKIQNIITNKCYIGETQKTNPLLRWNEHKSKIEKGIGCPALQDAVKKYGIENFKFTLLIICFDEDRYKYEMEYIKKYNTMVPNGYNLTPGGEGGGFYGKKHSQETINKLSNFMKNRYLKNPELKNEMSNKNKIIMASEEIKEKGPPKLALQQLSLRSGSDHNALQLPSLRSGSALKNAAPLARGSTGH